MVSNAKSSVHAPIAEIHNLLLDRNAGRSLSHQLYFAIREAILAGGMPAGAKLPSSRSLARELGVSRNTVASAYSHLLDEGFIAGRHGSGSYVSETLPDRFLRAQPEQPVNSNGPGRGRADLSRRGKLIAGLDARAQFGRAVPFSPGVPDLARFPLEPWSRLVARCWRRATRAMLSYAHPAGYQPLREAVSEYLRASRAVRCSPEQVIMVSGAQQALDLTSRLLLDPGAPVWVEEPGYHGAKGAFAAAGAELVPVPLDDEGLNIRAGAERCGRPRLIYVTPSHQYPSGVTMTLPRRLHLLEFARDCNAWIVEDDYDSEYRYGGRPLASLQGLDEDGRVIYTGTFSKVLVPSLRVGYLVVPVRLAEAFWNARSYMDGHQPTVTQAALAEFLREGTFASHIRKMRGLYASRQQILAEGLRTGLGDWLSVHESQAGMHLTCVAKRSFDDLALTRICAQRGLQIRPLSSYYLGDPRHGLVLGYAGYDRPALERGLTLLRQSFEAWASLGRG